MKILSQFKKLKFFFLQQFSKFLFSVNSKSKYVKGLYGLTYQVYPRSALDNHIIKNGILPDYICLTNQLKLSKKSIIFDVGANAGFVACVLAKKYASKGKVHAYEPDPQCFKQLVENKKINNLNNLEPHQIALQHDHYKMRIPFYIRRLVDGDLMENRGLSSIYNIKLGAKNKNFADSSTIDNEVKRLNINRIDFIKIDVEGGEFFVIQGAVKSICKFYPTILYEYSNAIDKLTETKNTQQTFNFLKKLGYIQFLIDKEISLIYLPKYSSQLGNINILAFHQTKLPIFLR